MKLTLTTAVIYTAAMGAVIFFCRAFPFIFFARTKNPASKGKQIFLDFVERIAPPAAMTVLAFYSLGPSFKTLLSAAIRELSFSALPVGLPSAVITLAAAILTAAVHLWKRNALISIFGGTALFMILQKIFVVQA